MSNFDGLGKFLAESFKDTSRKKVSFDIIDDEGEQVAHATVRRVDESDDGATEIERRYGLGKLGYYGTPRDSGGGNFPNCLGDVEDAPLSEREKSRRVTSYGTLVLEAGERAKFGEDAELFRATAIRNDGVEYSDGVGIVFGSLKAYYMYIFPGCDWVLRDDSGSVLERKEPL